MTSGLGAVLRAKGYPGGMDLSNWEILASHVAPQGEGVVVCVANQKGGVGKTTTCVNLAAGLALAGHAVAVVDLDPQANATTGLGIDHRTVERSSYNLIVGSASMEEVAVTTSVPGLSCVPSSLDLAGAEIELVAAMEREHRLAESLAGASERYRIVLLDCPPSLGLLTVNALVAARDVLVPVQCEFYALEAVARLLGSAERVRAALNPELRIGGVVLTMYDARTRLAEQVALEVRGHFGDLVYDTVVPRSVRLSEAPSFGESVVTLDPGSRGSQAYRALALEVVQRYGLDRPPTRLPAPPGGRGYGTRAPEPDGVEEAWPRVEPWHPRPEEGVPAPPEEEHAAGGPER